MKVRSICLILLSSWAPAAYATGATNVDLGDAAPFAVLAGSTATNTNTSVVNGDLGVYPGTALTGFVPPTIVTGTTFAGDATAQAAQASLTTAYNAAAAEPCGTNETGSDLGGLSLTTGVYCFNSSAQLTGQLTLNAQGIANSVFVFQIGSTLTTASNSSVIIINGAPGDNVFWQVGSSATLGTGTQFIGDILASASITLTTGADITCGSALASTGEVTMDTNTVSTGSCDVGLEGSASPEPQTATLLGMGLFLVLIGYRIKARKHAR